MIPVTNDTPVDIPGPEIQLHNFPLNQGNMWVYDNGDTIRVISDTTINGEKAKKLTKNNSNYSFDFYCTNRHDGLYMLAATSITAFSSLCLPPTDNNTALQVLSTPVQLTKLPVIIADNWTANIPNRNNTTRGWEKYATVICRADSFNCLKTRLSDNIDEYYYEKGIAQFVIQPLCISAPCPPTVIKLLYVNF